MSTVRMCDFQTENGPCGTIFSEKERGWSTGVMAVIGEDGIPTTEAADFCPDHSPRPATEKRAYPRFRATTNALPAAVNEESAGGWESH